jgi:hypothetical protein
MPVTIAGRPADRLVKADAFASIQANVSYRRSIIRAAWLEAFAYQIPLLDHPDAIRITKAHALDAANTERLRHGRKSTSMPEFCQLGKG